MTQKSVHLLKVDMLIFAVLDVSLTMGLTRCYKTEGFLHLSVLVVEVFHSVQCNC